MPNPTLVPSAEPSVRSLIEVAPAAAEANVTLSPEVVIVIPEPATNVKISFALSAVAVD